MKATSNVIRVSLSIIAVIVVGLIVLVYSVAAYHANHRAEHRDALEQLLATEPSESQLQQKFGSPLQSGSTEEVVSFARQTWGSSSFAVSPDLAQRAPNSHIYLVSDMVYLIFLDASHTMVDFALLNN